MDRCQAERICSITSKTEISIEPRRVHRDSRGAVAVARIGRYAVFTTIAAAGSVLVWMMTATTVMRPIPETPSWMLMVLLVTAATALAAGLASRPPWLVLLLGIALGMTVTAPWLAPLARSMDSPVYVPLPFGMAVAAIVVCAPLTTPGNYRSAAIGGLTGIVWLSFVMGLWCAWAGYSNAFYLGQRDWVGSWQLKGIAGHPNMLAVIAALALALQIQFLRYEGSQMRRRTRWILITVGPILTTITLVWTQSRTGWIAGACVVAVLALRLDQKRARWSGAVLVAAGIATAAPPVLGLLGVSFHGRSFAWKLAEQAIAARPLMGSGPWYFSDTFWRWVDKGKPTSWEPMHAHNQLLQTGVLLGAVGLLLLVLATALAAVAAVRARVPDRLWAVSTMVVLGIFAGVEPVLGVLDIVSTYVPVVAMALVLGAATGLVPRSEPEPQRAAEDVPWVDLTTGESGAR